MDLACNKMGWVPLTKSLGAFGQPKTSGTLIDTFFQVPLVVVDSYYYGKLVVAPLNIVLYNVFTSHGPDLYGEFKITRQEESPPFSCYCFAAVTHQVMIADYLSDVLKIKSSLQAPKGCSFSFLPQDVSLELEIGRP